MGRDLDRFVHPDRISSQLICPICTQVLENPVQTSTEHLFCEDELLEWMTRSSLCPITKTELDPATIRKPGRIITNMLAELEMYCENRDRGCAWTGPQDQLSRHMKSCAYKKSAEDFQRELVEKDDRIRDLEIELDDLSSRHALLLKENSQLRETIEEYQRRIRVFNALLPSTNTSGDCAESATSQDRQIQSLADTLSELLHGSDFQRSTVWDEDGDSVPSHWGRDEDESKEDVEGKVDVEEKASRGSDAERLRRLRGLASLSSNHK